MWRALGDEDHADTGVPEATPHIIAPLPIPIADQADLSTMPTSAIVSVRTVETLALIDLSSPA